MTISPPNQLTSIHSEDLIHHHRISFHLHPNNKVLSQSIHNIY